jgi:hypothetical protein
LSILRKTPSPEKPAPVERAKAPKKQAPKAIAIGGHRIPAGHRQTIKLPLPSFYTNTAVSMPIHVIHGQRTGACLLLCAAIHGDELNGVEIIRRVLGDPNLTTLAGTVIAIPVVNVFGFITQSRYLPDRRDLNRSFPGSDSGSMAARLAHLFMTEAVAHATHIIDLHTGAIGRENLPQIRAQVCDRPEVEALARSFGAPVILHADIRDGSLREAAQANNCPTLLYEAGEALRFDEVAIRAGCYGILGVMAHLGMIEIPPGRIQYESIISNRTQWVRATRSGILRALVETGERVAEGDLLASINDPLGEHDDQIYSPVTGVVICRSTIPLVHEGDAIFHISVPLEGEEVPENLGLFQDQYDPFLDLVER